MRVLLTIVFILSFLFSFSQGNLTGYRVQANGNLLPPLDTTLAPYRVGEIRTKVSGGDTSIFVAVSLSAPKKWAFLKASVNSSTSLSFNSPLSLSAGTVSLTTVPVNLGGTGATSFTANRIVLGNGTSALTESASFTYNPTTNRLQMGTATSANAITVRTVGGDGFYSFFDASGNIVENGTYSGSAAIKVISGSKHYQIRGTTTAPYGIQMSLYNSTGSFVVDDNNGNNFLNVTSGTGDIVINETGLARSLRVESDNDANMFVVNGSTDRIGVGTASPTAKFHLPAGTATASTAPFKYTSGTNLTTPENGAKEYDGSNEFLTAGGVRYTLAKTLTATASLDFPSVAAGTTEVLTITVTGAADGDIAQVGVPIASQTAGLIWQAYVSATNTATVSVTNTTGGDIEPATATFRVSVLKY